MPLRVVDRFVDLLVRFHRLLLVLAVILAVASIGPSRQLSFDQSIESMYAANNPHLQEYIEGKKWFGGDEFVFVAYTDKDLFSEEGLERLEVLADELSEVKGVAEGSVQSLPRNLAVTKLPFFKNRRKEILEFSRGVLLGPDDKTTAVALRLIDAAHAPVSREQTLADIHRIAEKQPQKTYVVGEPVLVHDMFKYAEEDGEWMGWAASLLLILVILFFLRSLRAVILPFIIVQLAILWTKAILYQSGMQLSMVSSILGSLVTIIGVSTVVYMSLFYRSLREQMDREKAFRETLAVIGTDLFWVCLTTAAGFGAQLSSHLHPVRSFGITMVIGSLLVLVAMILVLPGGFLIGREKAVPPRPRGDKQMHQSLEGLTHWVLRHPAPVLLACGLLMAFGISGVFRLKIETDFSKNFRSSSPVVQGLNFLETKLGGAGAWEVNFPAPDELDEEHLDKVRRLANELRKIPGDDGPAFTKIVAATDGIDMIPNIPLVSTKLSAKEQLLNRMQPEFLPSLYNPDEHRMRIMLRSYERQPSEEKEALIQKVRELAKVEFPEAKVTGLFVLLTYLIDSLLHDQMTDLILGTCFLLTIMTIAYRSLWMGVVSLVPNVIPIVLLLGGMGWLGVRVNIGTAMISSDTMGLTIHDSIFYLSAFLRARRSGAPFEAALDHVQTEVRQPLLYSNFALILGFLVLATSHFIPLIYFGVMVSVAIAGGLLVNLLLLPLFLQFGEFVYAKFHRVPVDHVPATDAPPQAE